VAGRNQNAAIQLSQNRLLEELFKEFKQSRYAKWKATRPNEVAEREALYAQAQAISQFEIFVKNTISGLVNGTAEQ
jgi:hypothetical protein